MDNDSSSSSEYDTPANHRFQRRNAFSGPSSGNLSREGIRDLLSGRGINGVTHPPPVTNSDNSLDTAPSTIIFTMPQWSEATNGQPRQQNTRHNSGEPAGSEIESGHSAGVASAQLGVDVGPHDESVEDRGRRGDQAEAVAPQDDQDRSVGDKLGVRWKKGDLVQVRNSTIRGKNPVYKFMMASADGCLLEVASREDFTKGTAPLRIWCFWEDLERWDGGESIEHGELAVDVKDSPH